MGSLTRFVIGATALAASCLPAASVELEVMHYWVASSERAAIAEIRKAFELRGGTWTDRPMENYPLLRSEFASMMAEQLPIGAVQWVPDVAAEQLVALQAIGPVDDDLSVAWKPALAPFIWNTVTYDDDIYFVPVGVHVENWMWVNKSILDRHGLAVPRTWPDFLAVARTLKDAGEKPIALASDTWTHNMLIRSVLGGAYETEPDREAVLSDWRRFITSPKLEETIGILAELAELVEVPSAAKSWSEATADVAQGRAAIQFMGDWAKAELVLGGAEIGRDIVCALPPGNDWILAAVVDSFAFPPTEDPKIRAAQRMMAESVMDPKVQIAFSARKGSTPARSDVSVDELDPCARIVMEKLADPAVRKQKLEVSFPAHGGSRFMITLDSLLIGDDMSPEKALATIRALLTDPSME